MLLTAKLPGFKDPIKDAPAVCGYGCRFEGFELVCKTMTVHHQHGQGPLEVQLYEKGKQTRTLTLLWPDEMEQGIYTDIRLRLR